MRAIAFDWSDRRRHVIALNSEQCKTISFKNQAKCLPPLPYPQSLPMSLFRVRKLQGFSDLCFTALTGFH